MPCAVKGNIPPLQTHVEPIPMRQSISWRIAALSLMTVCGVIAIAWNRSQARAAIPPAATVAAAVTQFGGAGGAEDKDGVPDIPRIYVRMPYGPEAISAYGKLQKRIDIPFAQETPLADVIRYVADQLNPTDEHGKPLSDDPLIQFYVAPRGLEEAEKTVDSPVTLELKQVPASTALELCLEQLDLTYFVRPDGIVQIDAKRDGQADQQEPMLMILNELHQLRAEISQLRLLRGGMGGGMGGMGGGMGGAAHAAPGGGGFN
jgi:hypothetical protein